MGIENLKHADPDQYRDDLKAALDAFEEALTARYIDDLDAHIPVWTVDGVRPDPVPPGPGVNGYFYSLQSYAPSWASEARQRVELCIPDYEVQDLNKIEAACNCLVNVQNLIGGHPNLGPDSKISELVHIITRDSGGGRGAGPHEFNHWAGISGEAYRKDFGQFVDPTMENQTAMAAALVRLYAGRASIVEYARGNTIAKIRKATRALDETRDSGEETLRWTALSVAAIGVGLAGTGWGVVASFGAVIGSLLDGRNPDQEDSNEIEEVVTGLWDALIQHGTRLEDKESAWSDKVADLQNAVQGERSERLELYDFTGQGGQSSSPPAGGFGVDVENIRTLARHCFEASEEYESVIRSAIATDYADYEMCGKGNDTTVGDRELLDLRNAFISFLQTTCARYYEAGSRLTDAARQYYGAEAENEAILRHLARDLDLNGLDSGNGGSVDSHIERSDREDIEDWEDYYQGPGGQLIPGEDYR